MKKLFITFSAFILLMLFNTDETLAAKKFSDVNTYYDEITYLTEMGIIQGYEDGTFKPDRNVTNTHVAVMLGRALQLDQSNPPDPGFKDVPKTHYAYKEIAAAVEIGIFPKSEYFNPSKPSTRQSMARALVVGLSLSEDKNISFPDVPSSSQYKDYISVLASNQITTGYADGTFKPLNELSRAHFSAFVARSLNDKYKPQPQSQQSQNLTTSEIVEMHDKRVVTIETNLGSGSGVLVGNGIILTNEHVIDGMNKGEVIFNNGKRVRILGVVVKDKNRDLALVKIAEDIRLEKVTTRHFEQLVKGEKVVAIGSPKGLTNTVSEGLVSALRNMENVKIIQTSASIDSGSSGGGLFDVKGNLVGITTFVLTDNNANLNFAVSISEIGHWESILLKSYNSIQTMPLEQVKPLPVVTPAPPTTVSPKILRNLTPGMTKVQVKAIEKGRLIHETGTSLTFDNAQYYGFPVDIYYEFVNGKLDSFMYTFLGIQNFNVNELETLFIGILGEMERELGKADSVDFNWYDDGNEYRLAAYWHYGYKAGFSVTINNGVKANIAIFSQ